ncbi:MAG: InlB B-repeat-containing protein [Treponemataceae bacterium]|nr:InlB B-repeat-containing protein [Treponemataceae bacterium]
MKSTKKIALAAMTAFALILAGCAPSADDTTEETTTTETPSPTPTDTTTADTPAETKSYTVTFNSNGGNTVEAQTVEEGKKATKPSNPTKTAIETESYAFSAWYSDSALTKAFDFDTAITADITLYAKWTVTPITYIGTKVPSVAKEVGDIVFTDGSAMSYEDFTALDEDKRNEKKTAAIALIFYKGTGLNSDDSEGNADTTTSRTLGVGLKHTIKLAWALFSTNACQLNIETIQCPENEISGALIFTGDKNGSDNLEQIAAFLTGAGVTDDTTTAENYPAFYFAKNYKDTATNLAGTAYENGWYFPSAAELYQIYACKVDSTNGFDIGEASESLGGSKFEDFYFSSSQCVSITLSASGLSYATGVCSSSGKAAARSNTRVCAIREFN